MNFETLQEVVDQWTEGHGPAWDKFEILARLTEDLGQVSATLHHAQGLRSSRTNTELSVEIGDLLFTLAAFANVNGLRLSDCVSGVLEKYQTRESAEW